MDAKTGFEAWRSGKSENGVWWGIDRRVRATKGVEKQRRKPAGGKWWENCPEIGERGGGRKKEEGSEKVVMSAGETGRKGHGPFERRRLEGTKKQVGKVRRELQKMQGNRKSEAKSAPGQTCRWESKYLDAKLGRMEIGGKRHNSCERESKFQL